MCIMIAQIFAQATEQKIIDYITFVPGVAFGMWIVHGALKVLTFRVGGTKRKHIP